MANAKDSFASAASGGAGSASSALGDSSRASSAAVSNKPQVDPELVPFLRAENEDDDGYDPYSDRPPAREPLFEADPWA